MQNLKSNLTISNTPPAISLISNSHSLSRFFGVAFALPALSCVAFVALAEPAQSAQSIQPTQSTQPAQSTQSTQPAQPAQNPQLQSLHHQKTYLQEQLKDLEKNEQYQKDIETLQSKIQYLKQKQGLIPQQDTQPTQSTEPQSTQPQEITESSDENLEQVAENEQKLPFEIEPMNKEKSGAFIGLTFGVASFTSNQNTDYYGKKGNVEYSPFTSFASLDKAVGIYGLMIGYKHGITGGFGLRYYADINYMPQNKIWSMNYALNIDGLLNIVEKNHNFFGFFAGVGVGAQTHGWSDRLLESMLEVAGDSAGTTKGVTLQGSPNNHKDRNFSNPKTSVNVAINFGIRASLARHHDIELGVRFRPLRTTLIEEKIEPQVYSTTKKFGIQGRIGSPYDIFLRYVYVF
ncbi:outer membrane beta-barrel protein [Helicobacter sp. T3_23-1059]